MTLYAASLHTALDQPDGHPVGIGMGFLLICVGMIICFALMVVLGKKLEQRRGPRPPQRYPILQVKDEERAERARRKANG